MNASPRPEGGGGQDDPLAVLEVIERLDVGPVAVSPRRLVAPYVVTRGGTQQRFELIYRWEEDVFDDGLAARNLAAMIAAQAALNYGLFCGEMAFHGPLDAADRKFLREFAENTAREIYVNKLLLPNVFVTGAARDLPALKRERYLRARLTFEDHEPPPLRGAPWSAEPARHAVLSSGGKDSLLAFGLLHELGFEAHPVFVNESGRHWYTALNAYRHLAAAHPHTARVWTNSDRLFAWMLRHLPFVRPDFSRVRADIYPIRLWTVAVFLFGALPLLRKRGIGRLLIGNEYDTTERRTHRGIAHWSGMFDQSRPFDNDMTRYFRRKGWGVCQFSILRQMSELLVEKVLVERYPGLQRHQISCHAAHLDGERSYPCGACEKCRRIVGMLVALGADPVRCGYGAEQIARALKGLEREGVHQESAGAEHMAHLLVERGRLADGQGPDAPRARAHPEVLALRFDPVRSPVETIPNDLRQELYRLCLSHADGAVELSGRVWVRFDPLSREALLRPFPFQPPAGQLVAPAGRTPARGAASPVALGELTWVEARARFKEVDVALLPVGAIEQHGPHLPLDTDAFDAEFLARRVAEATSEPRPLVLPLVAYGVSYLHDDFSGTLSVSPETQVRLIHEIGMCAARWGITKLVIINGHGGNGPALHLAAQMINRDANIFTCVDSGETSDAEIAELIETPNDVHAGEIETSTTLAVRPELVKLSEAPRTVPRFSSRYLDFSSRSSVGWYGRTAKISRSGVMGDATRATREKGQRIWELMIQRLVELVEDLKRLSLDELHHRSL